VPSCSAETATALSRGQQEQIFHENAAAIFIRVASEGDLTFIMGSVTDRGLEFAADSKVRVLDEGGRPTDGLASKVTVYPLRGGNLAIAHAGMWREGDADIALHEKLRDWASTSEPITTLATRIAEELAQPLTQQAHEEQMPNLTQFLIGFYPPTGDPTLYYVSSRLAQPVAKGEIRAIGGDPVYLFTPIYPASEENKTRRVARKLAREISSKPSAAYDFPILVVMVSGATSGAVSREYLDSGLRPIDAPEVGKQIPMPFDGAELSSKG